jgi:hypothetical protein
LEPAASLQAVKPPGPEKKEDRGGHMPPMPSAAPQQAAQPQGPDEEKHSDDDTPPPTSAASWPAAQPLAQGVEEERAVDMPPLTPAASRQVTHHTVRESWEDMVDSEDGTLPSASASSQHAEVVGEFHVPTHSEEHVEQIVDIEAPTNQEEAIRRRSSTRPRSSSAPTIIQQERATQHHVEVVAEVPVPMSPWDEKWRCGECGTPNKLEEDPYDRGSYYCDGCYESWAVAEELTLAAEEGSRPGPRPPPRSSPAGTAPSAVKGET